MLVCKDVPRRWASDDLQRGARGPSLALRMHLMICRNCRRYLRELALIRAAARAEAAEAEASGCEKLAGRVVEAVNGERG